MASAAVIFNPRAGRHGASAVGDLAERVRTGLLAAGFDEVAKLRTEKPRHAESLAAGVGEEVSRVVVVGGDGTLREAVAGSLCRGLAPAFAIVPMGNANVLARELGLPRRDPDAAVRVACTGAERALDVGRANDHLFLAMVGLGFDASVVAAVDSLRRGRIGGRIYATWPDILYTVAGIATLLRGLPEGPRLELDGETLPDPASSLFVCNAETWSKGWALTPGASMADGLFDTCATRGRSRILLMRLLLAGRLRRRAAASVARYGRAKRLRIESDAPFSWQADGDPMEQTTRLEITIEPGRLRLLC